MTARQPTLIFDTVLELYLAINSIAWPALLASTGESLNTEGPIVLWGDLLEEPQRETIAVTGFVDDDDQSTWPEKGLNTKRETFSTELIVVTNVPNRTGLEAWLRLRQLVIAIDARLRDLTSGRPTIPLVLAELGVYSWWVSAVNTSLLPAGDGGGSVASAGVTVSVKADI